MKRAIEAIGVIAFMAGAAAMDSASVVIPSVLIIGGLTIVLLIERSLKNG